VNLYKSMGGGWVITAEGMTKDIVHGTTAEVQTPQK